MNLTPVLQKKMRRVQVDPVSGCWNWIGSVGDLGYGLLNSRGQRLAHRLFWIELKGIIPPGLEIDHTCRNRRCVNVDHLELVTHRENMLRGNTVARSNAAKTHCLKGHAYTPENTYHPPKNPRARMCRACNRATQAALRADPIKNAAYIARLRAKRAPDVGGSN